MFSRKQIAAVTGLVGGFAVAAAGLAPAYAAGGPGTCTRDVLGSVTCTQRIEGELAPDGIIPHQESCLPVQPLALPAAAGGGATRVGPEVTCTSTTSGEPGWADGGQERPGLLR